MMSKNFGSTLRRTKTCLRGTMIQERLNHGMLSIHTDKTDLLNLVSIY